MKHLLLTTIAAVVLVGCGESQQSVAPTEPVAEVPAQPSPLPVESKPAEPVAEVAKPTTPPKAVSANIGADPARGVNPKPPTTKATDISIHDAAYDGNIEAVKQYFAAGTDLNAKNKYGLAPLHYAANKEIAELLIAEDANVNAKDDNGSTPLHGVAVGGSKEIAELLIAKGADVNAKQKAGDTPLDLAIQFKEPEIADLIRKHGGKTGEELKAEGK